MGLTDARSLPLLADQLRLLDALGHQHPDHAASCRALITRWQQYIIQVKLGASR